MIYLIGIDIGTSGTKTIVMDTQGHPRIGIPGVDASTGSLGLGLSMAAGRAAPNLGLDNLATIIDRYRFQNDGATEEQYRSALKELEGLASLDNFAG